MFVFLNGEFVKAEDAKVSVFDHGFLYGDGCFETLRTYRGKLFRSEEHLKRLMSSAQELQIDFPWKEEEVLKWMEKSVAKNGFPESRLRITITRGKNEYDFIGAKIPTILIVATELKPHPTELYTQGAHIETLEAERLLPQIKSLNLLASTLGQQLKSKQKVLETILINRDGFVTEGTITNFFMVKNGEIVTAPAKSVLSGITRETVFELGKKLKLKVLEKKFKLAEMLNADEAFLTGTTLEICPVVKIGKTQVGDGKVGKITRKLMENFKDSIK